MAPPTIYLSRRLIALDAEMSWPRFWAIQILLFVLIVMYCTIDELARAIGKQKFVRMFFGPLPAV